MTTKKWLPVLPPFVVGLLGSEVYASVDAYPASWGALLGSVYYIPIVITAITLGARAAVGVAIAAGTTHGLAAAMRSDVPWHTPIAQMVLFTCVALTAARLASLRRDTVRQTPPADSGSRCELQPGTVIAGLARHFRNPLASIEGAGWVLDDPQIAEESRREFVGIVRKEANHLNRAVSDVIDFLQPLPPRFRPVSVAAIVDDVLRMANSNGHGSSCVFSRDIPADLPALRGDPEQLKQALLHLVRNSMQELAGGGHIAVSARSTGDEVVIAVEDDGPGIPDGATDRIFEPFFTTRDHSLGLGLPTALRIVTEHGGTLALDGQRSQGVRISMILPVRPAARTA